MPGYGIGEWIERQNMLDILELAISQTPPEIEHDTRTQIRALLAAGWPVHRIAIQTGAQIKTIRAIEKQSVS